jgi:hypothetical protein
MELTAPESRRSRGELVRARAQPGKELALCAATAEYYRVEAEGLVMEYDRGPDSSNKVQ